jgi:hypothetical protein
MILSCKMFIFTYSSFINPSQMPVKSCALLWVDSPDKKQK